MWADREYFSFGHGIRALSLSLSELLCMASPLLIHSVPDEISTPRSLMKVERLVLIGVSTAIDRQSPEF